MVRAHPIHTLILLPALLDFALGDDRVRRAVAWGDGPVAAPPRHPVWKRIADGMVEVEDMIAHAVRGEVPYIRLEDRVVLAETTPASLYGCQSTSSPELRRRQQNEVDAANQRANQAVQSAEQSARQAIQQAQESARQASESARQASESARQAGEQASQAVQRAQQSASDAIRQAQQSAAASASQQIQQNLDSVTRSAASAMAQQVAAASANARSSAESVISQAASSAKSAMDNAASLVNAAKAEGTAIKQDANLQVAQAQGTAISVTQTALIVVGAVIGTVLLTVLCFYFVIRYRKARLAKRNSIRKDIGYPKSNTNDMEATSSWPTDTKRPPSWPVVKSSSGPHDITPSKVGLATSFYDPPPQVATVPSSAQLFSAPVLERPPPAKAPAKGAQFAGFPKRKAIGSSDSSSSTYSTDDDDGSMKDGRPYLKKTQTVSPFGPIGNSTSNNASPAGTGSSRWPLGSPPNPM